MHSSYSCMKTIVANLQFLKFLWAERKTFREPGANRTGMVSTDPVRVHELCRCALCGLEHSSHSRTSVLRIADGCRYVVLLVRDVVMASA